MEKGVWPKAFKIEIKKVVEKIGFCVFTLKAPVNSSMPAAARLLPNLRPPYEVVGNGAMDTDQVSMAMAIMIVMIAIAGLTMILFKASPEATLKGTIMRSGMTAINSIIGVS